MNIDYSELCREHITGILLKHYHKSKDNKIYVRNMFYSHITYAKEINTKWISNRAYLNRKEKRPTLDHFITPRLMITALIEERPDILQDKIEFKKIFELCRSVVGVTPHENSSLRYDKDDDGTIVIKECTAEKYNKLGHWWIVKNNKIEADSVEFPLLDMIPTWFLNWEQKMASNSIKNKNVKRSLTAVGTLVG